MQIAFRPYNPATDLQFLFKAWISSYEKSPWAGTLPQHLSYSVHKATINQLIARGISVTMAVNPEDPDQILGFVAAEPGLLHYIFVKDLFRRQGVASKLMASANFDRSQPLLHTFRTPDARYLGKLIHRPGLARRKAAYP
jgi:GNAT superfamily N-acetyltransferase